MKKIVIKVGTSTLTQGTRALSRTRMADLARQLSDLHRMGIQVILVSSGAIAAGKEVMGYPDLERSLPCKQMFAAVGQVRLMQLWTELFREHGITVGQVLLTRGDIDHRKRYLNARNTLSFLLDSRVIPIVNENDTVATNEIKFGDNDTLSALVANLIAADLLILLTDQEGLFTADPRKNSDAKLIPKVERIDASIVALAQDSSNPLKLGIGGMATKIQAARLATQSGIPTVIASSAAIDILLELAEGKERGTFFAAQTTLLESRKRWLLSEKPQGCVHIDEGAFEKVVRQGASLLAKGVTKISQPFERGSIVLIASPKGDPFAVGVASYSSEEIEKLIGVHSNQIEKILSYSYGQEIVHRDNMVLL